MIDFLLNIPLPMFHVHFKLRKSLISLQGNFLWIFMDIVELTYKITYAYESAALVERDAFLDAAINVYV